MIERKQTEDYLGGINNKDKSISKDMRAEERKELNMILCLFYLG